MELVLGMAPLQPLAHLEMLHVRVRGPWGKVGCDVQASGRRGN